MRNSSLGISYKRILLFFIIFIVLFQFGCNSSPNQSDAVVSESNNVSFTSVEKGYLQRYFVESLKYNNSKKKNVLGLQEGKRSSLKSLLNGKQKLIIEYSPLSCSLCVDSLFTYINKSKLNKDLIIITGSKNRNLVKIELNKYTLNGYILMTDITPESLKELNHDPKLYFLDPDMTIHHYISIDKSMVKYLKIYLKQLEELI